SIALDAALAEAGVTEIRQVDLIVRPGTPAPSAGHARGGERQDVVELEVPELGPEVEHLVLACDEAGVLTWHLPVPGSSTPATSRGTGATKRFLIPAAPPAPAPAAETQSRSVLGVLGRKLLKVLVYRVTDPVLGSISDHFAANWEARKRP